MRRRWEVLTRDVSGRLIMRREFWLRASAERERQRLNRWGLETTAKVRAMLGPAAAAVPDQPAHTSTVERLP